jgi:small-conductance mechanosensitive channel
MKTGFGLAQDPTNQSNLWEQFTTHIWNTIRDTDMWISVAVVLGRIVLILVVSRIVLSILNRIIDHLTAERESHRLKLRSRRVQTVGRLLKNAASYTLYFIVILLILGEFNIDLAPLLAGAGVLGLAIGFGAQSLVKDVITGFFIILEDHFAVGDVIQTGAFRGTVELIGLRATRIRSWTGEVHILPNGSINEVTNFSLHNSLAIADITVAYEEKLDEVTDVIRSVLPKIEDPNMTGTPELLGVHAMGTTDVVLRITAECKPNAQAAVVRKIHAEVKKAFEEHGMDAPYPKMVTMERKERRERTGGS